MNENFSYFQLMLVAKDRLKSDADYVKFQEYQARHVLKDLIRILELDKDSFLIDYGCGKGGYTEVFTKYFRNVVGVDFFLEPEKNVKAKYLKANLLSYVSSDKADVIFCASVIEHVKDYEKLIASIKNNLKKKGKLYLSFPPFYSIGGGHHLKPLHYLPENIALAIGKFLNRIPDTVTSYENLFGTWGLYKRDINSIQLELKKQGFEIICIKPRYSKNLSISNLGLISNFLTWHVEFYCQKN